MSLHAGGRGFPDRSRPPGDRYQDSPRDRGAPWDQERRRERDHPRDRGRPHDESRDRDRRPRGEMSPGRGPRHWEDRKGGEFALMRLSVDAQWNKGSLFVAFRCKIGRVSGFYSQSES